MKRKLSNDVQVVRGWLDNVDVQSFTLEVTGVAIFVTI